MKPRAWQFALIAVDHATDGRCLDSGDRDRSFELLPHLFPRGSQKKAIDNSRSEADTTATHATNKVLKSIISPP